MQLARQVARSSDIDALFIQVLERVQARKLEFFRPGEDILRTHGISCSLRKGSNSEAQVVGIPEAKINQMNRWRKVERVAGLQPKFHMMEYYTEILIALAALLQYPSTL
jgi:hypothetical protein